MEIIPIVGQQIRLGKFDVSQQIFPSPLIGILIIMNQDIRIQTTCHIIPLFQKLRHLKRVVFFVPETDRSQVIQILQLVFRKESVLLFIICRPFLQLIGMRRFRYCPLAIRKFLEIRGINQGRSIESRPGKPRQLPIRNRQVIGRLPGLPS